MFILIFLVLVAYLSTGAVLARGDYARRLEAAGSRNLAAELTVKKRAQKALNHTNNCWVGGAYGHNNGHDCDCKHKVIWKSLQNEIVTLEAGHIAVGSPYPMFFAWPVKGLHIFLTNGSVKKTKGYDPELTARLQAELLELED